MRFLLSLLSLVGLLLTVVPSFLVLSGNLEWQVHARLMLVGMVFWFVSAPFWMESEN
jgi:hypothetical protein